MSGNEIYLKLKSYFEDTALPKVKAFTGAIGAQMQKAGNAIAGVNAMFGEMPGKIGAAINGVGRLATAAMTMGPIGAVVAGASLAFQWMQERATKAAKAIEDAAERMATAIRTRCDQIKNSVEAKLQKPLDEATTKADRAARAFNTLAAAYLKVANAKDATAKAGDDAEIAKLRADKASAMAGASGGDAAVVGSGYDVRIAERRAEAIADAHERNVKRIDQEAKDAQERLALAKDKERKATHALAEANLKLAHAQEEITPNDGGEWEKRVRRIREAAEKAAFDSTQARIAAEADATAAEEKLKQARLAQTAALADATAAVTNSKSSLASLEKAREDAAKAELEASRLKAEREAQERKRAEQAAMRRAGNEQMADRRGEIGEWQGELAAANARVSAARQAQASAWALYKDPQAMRAVMDAERDEAKMQSRFEKDRKRLMQRGDWRTAQLGKRDEATRRMILAQEAEQKANKEAKEAAENLKKSRTALETIQGLLQQDVTL